jgi:hypothetical protein
MYHKVLVHRIVLGLVCVVLAAMSLPVTAAFLDTILDTPMLLAVSAIGAAAIGAGAGALFPKAAGSRTSATRGAQLGGILGLVASIVGDIAWYVILTR